MTLAQLHAALKSLLTSYLGTYKRPKGNDIAAIWSGEPPSSYKASGLECRIKAIPNKTKTDLHSGVAITDRYRVRLVEHGNDPVKLNAALEAVMHRFETSNPTHVDANERLDLLEQVSLDIIF